MSVARSVARSVAGPVAGAITAGGGGVLTGRAFDFAGDDDSILWDDDPAELKFTGAYSMAAWLQVVDAATDFNNTAIIGRWRTSDGYMLFGGTGVDAGKLKVYRDAGILSTDATLAAHNGKWVHVGATVAANGDAILYVNGASAKTGNLGATLTVHATARPEMGNYSNSLGGWLDGLVRDCRVYSDVLTPDEVLFLATGGTQGDDPGTANLELWVKGDDTHETEATDSSPNGYTGVKTNIDAETFHWTGPVPYAL